MTDDIRGLLNSLDQLHTVIGVQRVGGQR